MTIRWGIIGCGDVTEVKSGPGFQLASGSALTAVMRRDGAKAEDYARRHGVPFWTTVADEVINHPEVDAVYVATPPSSHCSYALQVCAAGKPCYVEKPMARSHGECEQMVSAFRASKTPLFIAFYRRALPRFLRAAELIRSGRIGSVSGVAYQFASASHLRTDARALPWRFDAETAGGGLFLDLGSHTLDILDFLLGPLRDVTGSACHLAAPYDVEDRVALQFRTESGAIGQASWNFASCVHRDLIEITGTEGVISLSTFGNDPVRLERSEGAVEFDLPNPRNIQLPLIQTIVDELRGVGECPSTGVSGARASAVMDAALAGYYGGRNDNFWARPATWPGRPSS